MNQYRLTTDHVSSSYGIPAFLVNGKAYGPADYVPVGYAPKQRADRMAIAIFAESQRKDLLAWLGQFPGHDPVPSEGEIRAANARLDRSEDSDLGR